LIALLAAPVMAQGQTIQHVQWGGQPRVPAQALYRQGWEQGQRAGLEDARRGEPFRYTDESDYRRADAVLRQGGYDNRYRDEYRRGYEEGYRTGFSAAYGSRGARGPVYDSRLPGRGGPPVWSSGRGTERSGRATGRYDPAYQTGATDGYEAGLKDAQSRRRFDPISEGRYRDGDRGYKREYGDKDLYKARYRDGFRVGYEEGYVDAERYGVR
jgi:hypothetical protein